MTSLLFFLTVTANPQWPEVQNELLNNQTALDRPDLLCRVFQEKLCSILKELHNGIFGNYKVRSRSIEFQKRGPLHVHMLILVENFNPKLTEIDKIICA